MQLKKFYRRLEKTAQINGYRSGIKAKDVRLASYFQANEQSEGVDFRYTSETTPEEYSADSVPIYRITHRRGKHRSDNKGKGLRAFFRSIGQGGKKDQVPPQVGV